MNAKAESLKRTWESIFRRKGGSGAYTRLFDSFETAQRLAFMTLLVLREGELPVIGSMRGSDWLILTTERLMWIMDGKRHELAVETIRDATADLKQLQSGQGKLDMHTLKVTTLSGEEYTIELEPGQPLSGTWNVLKNLGTRNRHATDGTTTLGR